MRRKSNFVLFFLCFAFITNQLAQSQTSLLQNFKSKTELLNRLYMDIQRTGKTDQINKITKSQDMVLLKEELFSLKQELKGSHPQHQDPAHHLNSTNLNDDFDLLDFYMYDYTTDYYRIIARLRCKTKIYTDFVKLIYTFYQNSDSVGADYTYIDFESYGYAGMLPYQVSFLETFTDKVNFDSISIKISYWTENGTGDILWDQIMELDYNQIIIGPYSNEWSGTVRNKSAYAVTFPKIFACIFKDEKMIDLDYTYLDFIVEIYSVTSMPTDSEQVTLKNNSIKNSDISGWTIGDKNNPLAYIIPQGTILLPNELIKFTHSQLGFQIDDAGEIIYLKNDQEININIWEDDDTIIGNVKIYSVTTTPTEDEQITLKNYSDSSVDISHWTLGDINDPTAYRIPQGTMLASKRTIKFTHTQLGFQIDDEGETIYLKNTYGITIDTWYDPGLNLSANYQEKFYPNSIEIFDSYIDLPPEYDKIKYYLSYSLYSLEGSGNITSNYPTFTQLKYSGSERTALKFDQFLIDHESDRIQTQVDWDDHSNLLWQGPFYSRSVASLNHSYSKPGTYYLRTKSKDAVNSETNWSDSTKVEILPVPELKITTQQLKAGIYQKLFRDTLKAEGGISPYKRELSSGSLPDGLKLNATNGEIFGTPSASGSFSFLIMVTDAGNPAVFKSDNFQIRVNNNPPQLISANSINIAEHEALQYTANAIDPDGNVISYKFEKYPIWLTPANTIISGIPPEGAKDTSFVVIASDGELNDTLKVSLKVIPVNDPPVIISLAKVTAIEDTFFQYIARATDPEGDKITYAFKNCPRWMIAADSTISGIPLEGTKDTSFIVIASDGKLNDTLKVNVTIIPINDPPKIISAKIDTAYEDLKFSYTAKAIDPESDRINYIFKNYPTWLEPAGATISGIPLEGTKDSCFTVIASDGKLNDTLKVFVTVIPVNDPPIIISPRAVNAYEDSLFTYTAKATDPEHDEITYAYKNYPHWMMPSDSIISGLVKKGTVDTSFTVIASDGNLMDTLVVNVKFIEKNDPPQIISPAFATAYEDSFFNYTAKAIDHENDKITFIFKNYPIWLTPKDSTISGTPTEGIGDTSFIIIASDGELTDTLEIAITVIPINDPPRLISATSVNAYEDAVFQYTAKAIDPEDSLIAYAFKNYPHWLTASDSTISGIPKEGIKDSCFVIIANDGELSDSMKVTIIIIPVNDPPLLISAKIDTAYEDSIFTYLAQAIDPENDKINYSFANYPKWLAPSDSMISGIPREGAKDTAITVIASDNYLTDTLCVTIIVIPINDPPQIRHLSDFAFKNNETYSINLDTCVIDEDDDVESLTWKVIPSDANLTMNMTNHVVSFNAPNWTGTTEIKFIVSDPEGASDSTKVTATVELPSVVENYKNMIPKDFFLNQNYPNPFNPQTTINFGIPKSSDISIIVYNVKGEIIEYIFKGKKEAGNHLVIWDAKDKPSGIYLIRLQADNFNQIRKCLLLK